MIKILTVIGARPQIIKAAAINRAIDQHFSDKIQEVILHTGQHYDDNMSAVFFDELGIPQPDIQLSVGSSSHARQTAEMMIGIEDAIKEHEPNMVLLYGDTNSTLAGSIAAIKVGVDAIHVEAGLRSFDKKMPEEVNRIVCDHNSTLLFTPTSTGLENLKNEGFDPELGEPYSSNRPGVFHCGDVMYDNSMYFAQVAKDRSKIIDELGLVGERFVLITVHRDFNTDDEGRMGSILKGILELADTSQMQFVFPIHPRTRKIISQGALEEAANKLMSHDRIKVIEPLAFLDMIALEDACSMVMTDSGGVQKEAYFFKKPCLILRPSTEWVELVELGAAKLVDADHHMIINEFEAFANGVELNWQPIFGDGRAAEFICEEIIKYCN